ncbi:hypothetical protein [Rickettsiella endosymbiont of Rhagonycha lignosa]|uniref:hypothetical protein n=1 Tax=Rickettsiella endosymbiont of Rhagonycha lignosa TaxID=3077937 RepID=UPI00313DD7B4
MSKKEMLEELKRKNVGLEEELNQPFKERVKKINKYLSRYLYSLLGISITGSLLALAAFFTPWLPSVATALIAFFTTVISALALPLLITIPIIAVALVLAPIAGFLWKKHQANSELNNSFEKLKKSLGSLEKEINEFDDEFDDKDEYEAEKNEIKMRQALCIHEFLATEKVAVNYDKIDELLEKCGISAEWIYVVDLVQKNHTIPDNQGALNDEIINRRGDQCDSFNSTANQVAGLDEFLFKKPLDIDTLKNISILFDTPKKQENLNQHNVEELEQTIRYSGLFDSPRVENSDETPQLNRTASLK